VGRASGTRRRIGGSLLATLFALALAVSPPAARTAVAAEPLRTEADATYTLDPDSGRVHVAIDVTETDLKPNSSTFVYYYVSFAFALQPEATSIRVSGGSAYRITTRKRDGYIAATVHIGKALLYKQSTSFTIRYDLVGGAPRSSTPTRVGAAYSTFGVWAWGDPGRSTVEVRVPAGFETRFIGDPMQVTTSATTGQILRAEPVDPFTFYTVIIAEDGTAYTETRLSLDGGVEIVVQSWPEDGKWRTAVTGTLRDAMPELRDLIGLDWPVAHDLDVRERYTLDLEGYAGFFLTAEQRIEVSEELDPVTIVHEASHAWFNDDLFVERWIYEGLAEEYAWRALDAAGVDAGDGAVPPALDDPGFADLAGWTHPGVIRDQETDDSERFGYEAAFWVVHQIVEVAGADRMREAFALADANITAYPGADAGETVAAGDGWRRLLDLTEPVDQPEPAAVEEAFRDFVLGPDEEAALDDRAAARAAYRALLELGAGWLAPWYVRGPMGEWAFDDATARMGEARAVLGLRDEVALAAAALDLVPDDALETAYEGAKDSMDPATSVANRQLATLAAIADARTAVDAAPDLVSQIGLIGETPRTSYDGSRSAFHAGNLDQATALAAAASSIVGGAAAIGQQRLLIAVVSIVALLLLLGLFVTLRRRRSRRRHAVALPGIGMQASVATDPDPTEPYATLAAHPAMEQDEGGHARGDLPGDP
jgi:hypothetical protein